LRNACLTAGRCTATAGSTNLNNAFDTSFYTGKHLVLIAAASLEQLLWLWRAVAARCLLVL
jgi:hypothetical protein